MTDRYIKKAINPNNENKGEYIRESLHGKSKENEKPNLRLPQTKKEVKYRLTNS